MYYQFTQNYFLIIIMSMIQENQNKAAEPASEVTQEEATRQNKNREQSQNAETNQQQQQITSQSDEQDEDVQNIQKGLQQINLNQPEDQQNTGSPKKQADDDVNQPQQFYTRDFIEINKNVINFDRSTLFPGSIDEVEISINLKEQALNDFEMPKGNCPLRVIALCNESKFNDLDEYVFSVRDNNRFQYFQEVNPVLTKNNRVSVKVAVKIPIVKQSQLIQGTLSLQLFNTIPIFLSINARCQIPQVICLKQLFDIEEGVGLIKIPAKKNMRMPPLPFKNLSAFNFMLEAETLSSESFANRAYDVTVSSIVNCSANTPFFVNIQLKPNLNYRGVTPKTDILRKVLVLKLKNSSVCFSYPIQVYVYQSTNGSSVS